MNTQMTSRHSIMPAKRLFSALYLVIAMLACSLMPFASPAAWAELQSDTGVWGVAMDEEISRTLILSSANDGSGGWKVRFGLENVVRLTLH